MYCERSWISGVGFGKPLRRSHLRRVLNHMREWPILASGKVTVEISVVYKLVFFQTLGSSLASWAGTELGPSVLSAHLCSRSSLLPQGPSTGMDCIWESLLLPKQKSQVLPRCRLILLICQSQAQPWLSLWSLPLLCERPPFILFMYLCCSI